MFWIVHLVFAQFLVEKSPGGGGRLADDHWDEIWRVSLLARLAACIDECSLHVRCRMMINSRRVHLHRRLLTGTLWRYRLEDIVASEPGNDYTWHGTPKYQTNIKTRTSFLTMNYLPSKEATQTVPHQSPTRFRSPPHASSVLNRSDHLSLQTYPISKHRYVRTKRTHCAHGAFARAITRIIKGGSL